MALDRHWIETHIPHQDGMCLLDEVLSWNTVRVQCRSSTHHDSANPLRAHDRLAAVCGIEYAAQAMAVHGALIASRLTPSPRNIPLAGYLASVRNVTLYATRLDDVESDLVATAELVTGDERTVLYDFSVSGGGRVLLAGRATIVFNTALRELSLSSRTPE
ncbi:MAG: 3-hydroxylacyl-ACP dehydratase [Steroidobacteraceae bacterium]